jgi:hypothetical protein
MNGQCHCGAVQFDVELSDGYNTLRRCTCSYCRMRGAIAVSAAIGSLRILRGDDVLTSYRFNTGEASTSFARSVVSTHITSVARTRSSTVSMWHAWKASARSIFLKCRSWTECSTLAIMLARSGALALYDTSVWRSRLTKTRTKRMTAIGAKRTWGLATSGPRLFVDQPARHMALRHYLEP